MKLRLAQCNNPDRDSMRDKRPKPILIRVSDLKEASQKVKEYISKHNLGGGNWSGGEVYNEENKHIANISYNGRIWGMENL